MGALEKRYSDIAARVSKAGDLRRPMGRRASLWRKTRRLIQYASNKWHFMLLRWRFREELLCARPLASHLEVNIFPMLHSEGEKYLTIDVAKGDDSQWLLRGKEGERDFDFPGTQSLAGYLRDAGIRRLRLDHHLEAEQILEALLILFYVKAQLPEATPLNRQPLGWNPRHIAGGMRGLEGFHKSCSNMRYYPDELAYEVEYTYCELLFSKVIRRYLRLRPNIRDHRVIFAAAPRVAVVVFFVLVLPIALIPAFPSLGVVVWLLAALTTAVVAGVGVQTLGSIQYDKEHGDMLIEEYVRRQRQIELRLRNLNEDLRRMTELQEEFMRIASHDLKNPLAAVLGSASLVGKMLKPGEPVPERLYRALLNIEQRAREMQQIIEDFLEFQALEGGRFRLDFEELDLVGVARRVLAANEDYAKEKGISARLEMLGDPPRPKADPARVSQVLQNLVGNAIKFSQPGGEVRVLVAARDGHAHCEVRDNGPGLTAEDLRKAFQKFARLSNKPTGGEKSSGLGLYICRQIIELHQGKIGVRNNNDGGSTFWFAIPLEQALDNPAR
jgi:signal transduction histidine kinase